MSGKSVSSGTKNPAKYFKWCLEKRLLLIDTVTKVDEEQRALLHSAGKVVDVGSGCGTTSAPAVDSVPLTTAEKWQEVASRLPPDVFHDIDRAKLESTCRSQFVKLHQRLQFMKRDSHDRYRRHGKPDAIMTDEICQKIATYRAKYVHRGRKKDLAVQSEKKPRGRPPLHKNRGEQVSGRIGPGRRRKLARGRPVHKGRGGDAPGSSEKLQQQRTLRPRKLARGRHPFWKGSGQLNALARKFARGRRPLQKGVERISLSEDDPLCIMLPQRPAEPSQVVSQGCGRPPLPEKNGSEVESVRNDDEQLCKDDHGEPGEEHAPVAAGLFPLEDEREEPDREQSPMSDDKEQSSEDSEEPGGGHAPVRDYMERYREEYPEREHPLEVSLADKQQSTEDSGESGGQQAASEGNQLCAPPKLSEKFDGSQVAALTGAQQKPQSQQQLLDNREALETKLCKGPSFARTGMFRWSEAARLQVIHGVKMMNNVTEAGQIRSWRKLAERLPMRLFWDIDLDRLATIAKKQFSEMRRRYRIMKDNELAGVAVKFKTLTKKVLYELEEYEESCLQRTPQTPSLCGSSHDRRWITKRPHGAYDYGEFSNAEGTVLVEPFSCFSSSENSMENASARSIHRRFDSSTGRHQRITSREHHMESSDFEGRASFRSYSNSEASRNSESSYREFIEKEDHYAKFSNGDRRRTSKLPSYDREADFDLRSRQTTFTFEDERHSEPQHESESLRRRRRCSSYRSYNSLEDNMTSNRKNQLNRRFQNSERQRRVASYLSDDFGPRSGQNHGNSLSEVQIDYRARRGEYSRDRRCLESYDPNDFSVRDQARNQEGRQYGQSSAQYSDSVSEESFPDSRHYSEEQDHNRFAYDEGGSHSNDDGPHHINGDEGTQGSDDQFESPHRYGDRRECDSAYSTDNDSKSRRSDSAHEQWIKFHNQNPESEDGAEDFVQSDSGEDLQRDKMHGKSQDDIQWKRTSSPDRKNELANRVRETSRSNHSHWEHDYSHHHRAHPSRKRARANGEFNHCESALPLTLTKGTDTSEPEQDEMSKNPRAPVLDQTMEDLDLEYSKLDWWMKDQLFPMEKEKIAMAIKSTEVPGALSEKRQVLGSDVEGDFDKVVNKCRRKRIRLVIKAEFQQVRLKLVQEIQRSSQVVVEEILDSFRT